MSSDTESEQEETENVVTAKNRRGEETIGKNEFLSFVNLTPRTLLTQTKIHQYDQSISIKKDAQERSFIDKIYLRFLRLKLNNKFTFSLPFSTIARKYSNQYFRNYFYSKKSFYTNSNNLIAEYKITKNYDKYCNRFDQTNNTIYKTKTKQTSNLGKFKIYYFIIILMFDYSFFRLKIGLSERYINLLKTVKPVKVEIKRLRLNELYKYKVSLFNYK